MNELTVLIAVFGLSNWDYQNCFHKWTSPLTSLIALIRSTENLADLIIPSIHVA